MTQGGLCDPEITSSTLVESISFELVSYPIPSLLVFLSIEESIENMLLQRLLSGSLFCLTDQGMYKDPLVRR